jgi:hypothetical protein
MIDRFDPEEGKVAFVLFRWTDLTGDNHSGGKSKATYLGWGDIDVVRASNIVMGG